MLDFSFIRMLQGLVLGFGGGFIVIGSLFLIIYISEKLKGKR